MSFLNRQNFKLAILLSVLVHGAVLYWLLTTEKHQWPIVHHSYKPISIVIRTQLANGPTKVSDKPNIASSPSVINSRSGSQSHTDIAANAISTLSTKTTKNVIVQRSSLALTGFSPGQQRVSIHTEVTPVKPLSIVSDDFVSQTQTSITVGKNVTDAIDSQRIKENYLTNLRVEINQRKYYPRLALRLGKQGEVWVEFIIRRNGQITDISIRESSGVTILDRAARKSLEKLNIYKPFPEKLRASELTVAVKMQYLVYR